MLLFILLQTQPNKLMLWNLFIVKTLDRTLLPQNGRCPNLIHFFNETLLFGLWRVVTERLVSTTIKRLDWIRTHAIMRSIQVFIYSIPNLFCNILYFWQSLITEQLYASFYLYLFCYLIMLLWSNPVFCLSSTQPTSLIFFK